MKKIILKFGFISGAISASLMVLTFLLLPQPWLIEYGAIPGYAGMVLAFSVIFVGVRDYREQVGEGSISFGKALQAGLLIALISSFCYAITWTLLGHYLAPNFWDEYIQHEMASLRQSGAVEAVLQEKMKAMQQYKAMAANPFINTLMAMVEPLPVGLLVSLISAAILKKKPVAAA